MALANKYESMVDLGGSAGGELNLDPQSFYQSLLFVQKACSSASDLASLLNSAGVDSSLVTELGFDFDTAKTKGNETSEDLEGLLSKMNSTKSLLERLDPSLSSLFSNIDTQLNLVNLLEFGDMTSETDSQLYMQYLKEIYYSLGDKDESQLSDVEKYVKKTYEAAGYNIYDEYAEMQQELAKLEEDYAAIEQEYINYCCGYYGYDSKSEEVQRYIEATERRNQLKTEIKQYEPILKEKGLMEYSALEQIGMAFKESQNKKAEFFSDLFHGNFGELWDDACDIVSSDFATNFIVKEKVVAGVAKVGEWILDGVNIVSTAVMTPGYWLDDLIYGTDSVNQMWDQTMSNVAVDLVGEAEKWFYEDTSAGRWINNNSLLAYDSAGAEVIKDVTTAATEVAAAVSISVLTGGAATPIVTASLGFLEGVGEGGERQFNMVDENGNYTRRNIEGVGLSVLNGIGKASEWYGYSKLPNTFTKGYDALKQFGKQNITDAANHVYSTSVRDAAGKIAHEGVEMLKDTGTWKDVGVNVVEVIESGIESGEFTWESIPADLLGEYVESCTFDIVDVDVIQDVYKAYSKAESLYGDVIDIATAA